MSRVLSILLMLSLGLAARAADALPSAPPAAPKADGWTNKQLRDFMHELIDFVYDHHVVRDPARPVFGMTYEFYRDGKQVQQFGLDSMHDGLWLTVAMLTAHRAEPTAGHLDRVLTYNVPFYVNMLLHSDELFPKKEPTGEDRGPIAATQKGWIPRGWDDGLGFEKTSKRPLAPSYFTPSNHLAQDVADGLLNVWFTTRDPRIGEALRPLAEFRRQQKQNIPPLVFATAVTSGDTQGYERIKPRAFEARSLIGYRGMFELADESLASYNDGLAWDYDIALARHLLRGEPMDDFAVAAAASAYGQYLGMELFYDDRPWPRGLHLFDIQGQPKFQQGTGRLDKYCSTAKVVYGARGVQFAAIAQAVLPTLRKHPELWQRLHDGKYPKEPIVRIVDAPTKRDYFGSATLTRGETKLHLSSDTKSLHVLIEGRQPAVKFTIRHADIPGAPIATIDITGGKAVAKNDRGDDLIIAALPSSEDIELAIPYTVVPGQKPWMNGVENGRYAISLNGATGSEQVVYMLSSGQRIIEHLEADVVGTIETWHSIWKSHGLIPSGITSLDPAATHGFAISDAGNYAHLIRSIALLLIDRQGTSEAELIAEQTPTRPIPFKPLPASVIESQKRLKY
jgi:hypothetical protein